MAYNNDREIEKIDDISGRKSASVNYQIEKYYSAEPSSDAVKKDEVKKPAMPIENAVGKVKALLRENLRKAAEHIFNFEGGFSGDSSKKPSNTKIITEPAAGHKSKENNKNKHK